MTDLPSCLAPWTSPRAPAWRRWCGAVPLLLALALPSATLAQPQAPAASQPASAAASPTAPQGSAPSSQPAAALLEPALPRPEPSPAAFVQVPSAALTSQPAPARRARPWRLLGFLGGPGWLRLTLAQRTRVEGLWHEPRTGVPGSDQAVSLRTLLHAEARLAPVALGVEVIDARLYLADDDAPVNTTHGDPLDLLQAYASVTLRDLFAPGAQGRLRAGRMTLDLGSRRLVARNRFRNTINAFTGLEVAWQSPARDTVRGFATLPVERRPTAADALLENDLEMDRESTHAVFWGLFYGSRPWHGVLRGELYVLGLQEGDADDQPTRNRSLVTPGARCFRTPARGQVDFEIEGVLQVGRSRASSQEADTADLDHVAFFTHVSVGYTADLWWRPRLMAQLDYASGDRDPDDGEQNRFDTLFGARRFELGPTGIYGLFARSNLSAPGLRGEARPHRTVDAMVAYRPVWVAQARDTWTTTGLRDPDGAAGSFVGHQLEARVRWRPLAENLLLEVGLAHVWLRELAKGAPNANPEQSNPLYVYTQLAWQL